MEAALIAVASFLASFIGSWSAMQVHLTYLRRDIDRAHDRLDVIQGVNHFNGRNSRAGNK